VDIGQNFLTQLGDKPNSLPFLVRGQISVCRLFVFVQLCSSRVRIGFVTDGWPAGDDATAPSPSPPPPAAAAAAAGAGA